VLLTDGSDIYSNDAIEGGGAYLVTSTLTIEGSLSEIYINTATGNGGGVYAVDSTINLDDDAELYDNAAGYGGGLGSGGGAYLNNSTLYSDKASIRSNTTTSYGGGVYATNTSLVDMDPGGYPCTDPRCSQLSDNTAGNDGGAIYTSMSTVDLRQTFVENNTGVQGGALFAFYGDVFLYNDLIAGNDATNAGFGGDGLHLWHADVLGSENTFAYNPADGSGTAIFEDEPSTMSLTHSIIWGHATSIEFGSYDVTCSDVQGGYTGADNMDVDPLFVDPASNNFHLRGDSPVIDRCTGGLSVDFDNEARPVIYIRPATPYDMGADEASVRAGINGAGCAYGRIQDAVDAASAGDTIQVVADVFLETVNITSKDLTIQGGYDDDCTTYITGTTTIDGSAGSGSTLDVSESMVLLRNLNITGGDDLYGGGLNLVGGAQVTMDNTDVHDNQGTYGGGVYICTTCVATVTNDSNIYNNTALEAGGGARVWGKLVGDDWDSIISNNSAPHGGGVAVLGGVLYLDGTHVINNSATDPAGRGGGIYVYDSGVVTATGSTNVIGNDAYDGAGIYADDASVRLSAFARNNVATNDGGGVYLSNDSTLRATGTFIGNSIADWESNKAVRGAGIYVISSTVDFRGRIINNVASSQGAGIYADNSTINLSNTQVGGTGNYEANQLSGSVTYGGGLYLTNGTCATLNNTTVSSNTFPVTGTTTFGGGAYLRDGSALTLTNSTIERHLAPSISQGRGAGIYAQDSTVTLNNSRIISNTAGTVGGGVRTWNTTILNILNSSELSNNHALNGEGGAIAATGSPTITISNSTLQHNSADTDGGAVYLDAGTLNLNSRWDLRWNQAGGNGGAVAVAGTGNASFISGAGTSYMAVNTANGSGGALYLGNNTPVIMNAASGYQINLNSNGAGVNGGAACADSDGAIVLIGRVDASSNNAYSGNGGAFYLDAGSDIGLSKYGDYAPRVMVNSAQNGGAIYATGGAFVLCQGAEFGASANGNQATAGSGGALYLSGSMFGAGNCTFRNSQATLHGGAIAAYTSTLFIDADPTTCDPLANQCSSFYGNTADSDDNNNGDGGAIYVYSSTLQMDQTYLHRNNAKLGGAIYQSGAGAVAEINNTMIYSNTASGIAGAGIRVYRGAFTARHLTLANNTSAPGFSSGISATSAVSNSIAWDNDVGGFEGVTFVITSCNIDQSGNVGIAVNPQFFAPGAGENYRLSGDSPGVDACLAGLPVDLDGVSRPFGGGYDVGAYEYAYSVELAPDRSGSGKPSSIVIYTHTLSNTGGITDAYTLSAQSSQGWVVAIDPTPTVMLGNGLSTPVTVTIAIPPGALSGTVDTTVITATSIADPNVTACVTETTTVVEPILPTYVLTVNSVGNGTVDLDPPGGTYDEGTTVTLTANAAGGWYFIEWSGNLIGSNNPATLAMDGDKVITATFDTTPPTTHTLIIATDGTGTGTVAPPVGAHIYVSGTVVPIAATADPGSVFVGWIGDLIGDTNPDTITMDSDKTVTATFDLRQIYLPLVIRNYGS
jgi:hypothetical protein